MYWKGNLQVSVWFISIDNKRCFPNYEIISITLETSSHFAKIFKIGTEMEIIGHLTGSIYAMLRSSCKVST